MKFELLKELSEAEKARVADLIAPAIGDPTPDRLKTETDSYSTNNRRTLLVVRLGRDLAGCIGLKHQDSRTLEILHIAVPAPLRGKGLGRALIEEAIRRFSPEELIAETDDDAINFYFHVSFEVVDAFVNKWNVRRYRVRRVTAV